MASGDLLVERETSRSRRSFSASGRSARIASISASRAAILVSTSRRSDSGTELNTSVLTTLPSSTGATAMPAGVRSSAMFCASASRRSASSASSRLKRNSSSIACRRSGRSRRRRTPRAARRRDGRWLAPCFSAKALARPGRQLQSAIARPSRKSRRRPSRQAAASRARSLRSLARTTACAARARRVHDEDVVARPLDAGAEGDQGLHARVLPDGSVGGRQVGGRLEAEARRVGGARRGHVRAERQRRLDVPLRRMWLRRCRRWRGLDSLRRRRRRLGRGFGALLLSTLERLKNYGSGGRPLIEWPALQKQI